MYVRPNIRVPEFRDAHGVPIPYGRRWLNDGPPENSYSVTTHPQRFAPLHEVARALMAALGTEPREAGAVFGPRGPSSAQRFDPPNRDAAPIVVALTDFPGVRIRAGAYYSAAFPPCGCDACDEDVLGQVDDLERTVMAITAGRFSESVSGGWLRQSIEFDNGSRGGTSRVEDSPPALLDPHGEALRPRAWAAWA